MSKGSKQRKAQVSDKKMQDNWEKVFNKDICPVCLVPMTDRLAEIHRSGKECPELKKRLNNA